ncbi:hypothetical protein NN561_019253 [Cricetulus griseus]
MPCLLYTSPAAVGRGPGPCIVSYSEPQPPLKSAINFPSLLRPARPRASPRLLTRRAPLAAPELRAPASARRTLLPGPLSLLHAGAAAPTSAGRPNRKVPAPVELSSVDALSLIHISGGRGTWSRAVHRVLLGAAAAAQVRDQLSLAPPPLSLIHISGGRGTWSRAVHRVLLGAAAAAQVRDQLSLAPPPRAAPRQSPPPDAPRSPRRARAPPARVRAPHLAPRTSIPAARWGSGPDPSRAPK